MMIRGHLHKMRTELQQPVQYTLDLDDQGVSLNPVIGQMLILRYTGAIHCIHCGRKTNKSFSQGFCYPCFQKLAQCDSCIVSPEKCHYDQGTCREPEWAEAHCMQPHYVYLANSSGVKVGITRGTQVPTRWMDQGAVAALPIFKVKTRKVSGQVEVAFKTHVTDRTSWQAMLKGIAEPVDLIARRDELMAQLEPELVRLRMELGDDALEPVCDAAVVEIQYPVEQYPQKVKSFNFDKTPLVGGRLMGIKGQYLIFDTGVINIRKFAGYEVELESDAL